MSRSPIPSLRFGSRWQFAIECEISPDAQKPYNEWLGSVWLWVGGKLVGDPAVVEICAVALDTLLEAAEETGKRSSTLLSSLPAGRALDLVLWARYGDDDEEQESLVPDRDALVQFEILPRRGGPFFDQWQAIIIEEENCERFIFREIGRRVNEIQWPRGEFRRVVSECKEWFRRLGNSEGDGDVSPLI